MLTLAEIWPDKEQVAQFAPEELDNVIDPTFKKRKRKERPSKVRKSTVVQQTITPEIVSDRPVAHDVTHSCGHATQYFFRVPLNPADAGQLRRFATIPCMSCQAVEAAEWAQWVGLPLLTGTDEQVTKAELIRRRILEDALSYISEVNNNLQTEYTKQDSIVDAFVGKALVVPFSRAYSLLSNRTSAGWWIVRSNFSGRQIIQAYVEYLTRAVFDTMPERPRVPRELSVDPRFVVWQSKEPQNQPSNPLDNPPEK